ncbi:MAG: transposase, partial [Candidatus Nitrosotenuis sp.]
MKDTGYVSVYFGLVYRQTEGLIRAYHAIPAVHHYTAIHKRICRLDIRIRLDHDITLAVDSTGIKVTNRGEWLHQRT